MTFDLAQAQPVFWLIAQWASAFARVGAMMFLVPGLGENSIPMRVRLTAALAISAIIAPLSVQVASIPEAELRTLLGFILHETLIGACFGLLLRFFVIALQTAGSIAGQSTSLSQIFGGTAGADPQPAMGHLLTWAALAFAMANGMHIHLIAFLAKTYELFPIESTISADLFLSGFIERVSRSFALAFAMAAPFLIASMLYNTTLGVINRAMPQLMVSFVGAPAITAGGLLMLLVLSPKLIELWSTQLFTFMTGF